jgi:hypothetical protein
MPKAKLLPQKDLAALCFRDLKKRKMVRILFTLCSEDLYHIEPILSLAATTSLTVMLFGVLNVTIENQAHYWASSAQ